MTHAVPITRSGDTQPIRPDAVVLLDPATGLPAAPLAQGLTRAQLDAAPVGVSTQLLGGTIPAHNNVLMSYTGANLTTVQYRQNTAVVATVTMTYDALGNLLSATRS